MNVEAIPGLFAPSPVNLAGLAAAEARDNAALADLLAARDAARQDNADATATKAEAAARVAKLADYVRAVEVEQGDAALENGDLVGAGAKIAGATATLAAARRAAIAAEKAELLSRAALHLAEGALFRGRAGCLEARQAGQYALADAFVESCRAADGECWIVVVRAPSAAAALAGLNSQADGMEQRALQLQAQAAKVGATK